MNNHTMLLSSLLEVEAISSWAMEGHRMRREALAGKKVIGASQVKNTQKCVLRQGSSSPLGMNNRSGYIYKRAPSGRE
jgi:hypothetical protein